MTSESADALEKRMKLRFAGACRLCGTDLPSRAKAIYERTTKTVRCVECAAFGQLSSRGSTPSASRIPMYRSKALSTSLRIWTRVPSSIR